MYRAISRTRPRSIAQRRIIQMTSQISNAANGEQKTYTIRDLPKSNTFTQRLPPDQEYPTPASSHNAERKKLGPRLVKNAAYTFVRPEPFKKSELVGVSKAALRDLAIDPASINDEDFKKTVAGEKIITIDEDKEPGDKDVYPWAQCYGGYQFGQWAGQLGDGRAISLFEANNPNTGKRYEIQLKGAGKTPYSRFADGKAVVRSSIREFVVSEALNALGIPSTRALSLTLGPEETVRRETAEPAAMVARFAESWIRVGTFDLPRSRGDRDMIRKLADYVAEDVFGGWDNLPARVPSTEEKDVADVQRGISKDSIEGEAETSENRYTRLFREIARRNAKTVAHWQAYAFTNGVLNSDNTSIYGLSVDFGPFAFLDNFDPNYTPNHDDHMLRYSYKNQPSIIWWNLVRLAEAFGELIGAGDWCDDAEFVEKGVRQERADELIKRAETVIDRVGEEYKAVFMAEYKRLMTARLGLKQSKESDFQDLYSELLDTLEALELDFNHTFRRLSHITMSELETDSQRKDVAARFFHHEGLPGLVLADGGEDKARARIAKWLEKYRTRVFEDWDDSHEARDQRLAGMKSVNPKFIPRSWVLDELIERVEKKGEREILKRVMDMALRPFEEEWGWDKGEEERFCEDVPRYQRAMQCSCSS
ncbi:Adenylyltransferase, mitochondrial [Fulvia fulva]|nr:Adenylyltransferase, mitochondrial [Fulvia fulva]KAK4632484.1 Adenylyltransferase, mitochondrial [Fulvia fulva]WPV11981.1 Adenylyltransferase, mitochondrial [Fulvia fulva]WPV26531.1 Adenylyltransferase, mitochondrial [Fulvia fulva]